MNTINIPVLALRGMTAFPGETVSFDVEREISIFALDNAMEGDRRLFLVTQRKIGVSEPEEQDLYEIGTVCHVLQIIKTSETTVRVLVEGAAGETAPPVADLPVFAGQCGAAGGCSLPKHLSHGGAAAADLRHLRRL